VRAREYLPIRVDISWASALATLSRGLVAVQRLVLHLKSPTASALSKPGNFVAIFDYSGRIQHAVVSRLRPEREELKGKPELLNGCPSDLKRSQQIMKNAIVRLGGGAALVRPHSHLRLKPCGMRRGAEFQI
jgi:hypothetical protein